MSLLISTTLIARTAHEVNRAYCNALGDTSQPPWLEAPDWQRKSAIAGVEYHLRYPDATASDSHDSWMAQKLADGWTHGPTKDPEARTHPCLVPYEQLPLEQRIKDYLFKAVVDSMRDLVPA